MPHVKIATARNS